MRLPPFSENPCRGRYADIGNRCEQIPSSTKSSILLEDPLGFAINLFELARNMLKSHLDRFFDRRSDNRSLTPILPLAAHLNKTLMPADKTLQRQDLLGGRRPWRRRVHAAESCDWCGIHRIGCRAQQFALRERLDSSGIDNPNDMTGVM